MFVRKSFESYSVHSDITEDVIMAIDEAITNIIRHGYEDCNQSIVRISMSIEDNYLKAVIKDNGKTFDITRHPDLKPEKHLKEMKKGGLGVHIIKEFIDVIDYSTSTNGKVENTLILKKKLS
jgi:serine/threonine-protein kinase RsbW